MPVSGAVYDRTEIYPQVKLERHKRHVVVGIVARWVHR
jgi:hypothetical protein